jgi:hypothetical protein
LPSACGWCHQPPQGTRTPELLIMSRAHRACGSPAHGSPTSFTDWHTQPWPPPPARHLPAPGDVAAGDIATESVAAAITGLLSAAVKHALEGTSRVHTSHGVADGTSRQRRHSSGLLPSVASIDEARALPSPAVTNPGCQMVGAAA